MPAMGIVPAPGTSLSVSTSPNSSATSSGSGPSNWFVATCVTASPVSRTPSTPSRRAKLRLY